MKIAVMSFFDSGFHPLTDITIPNLVEYCKRWGYSMYLGEPFKDVDARDTFERIIYAYHLLQDKGYDAVMWIDGDAIITNHNIRIEDRIADHKFVIAADIHGYNAGVFMAANYSLTKQFLFAINHLGKPLTGHHPFREQESIVRYLSFPPYQNLATVLPQRMMNSYLNEFYGRPIWMDGNWEPGDWILHLPGMSLEQRVAIATALMPKIVK
jgi:hypothetical protein